MTKKYYKMLAKRLQEIKPDSEKSFYGFSTWCACVVAVAEVLKEANSRFDKEKFIDACHPLEEKRAEEE